MKKQASLFGELEGTPLLSATERALKTADEVVDEIKKVVGQANTFDPFTPPPTHNGDKIIIYGNTPSKSNCYRIVIIPGKKGDNPFEFTPEQLQRIDELYKDARWKDLRDELNKFDDGSKRSHPTLAKSSELKAYEKAFAAQLKLFQLAGTYNQMIDGDFLFEMDVYYPSKRSDLDNSLKIVLDCLQECEAIKNDNGCVDIHVRKRIDKDYPRIEFKIVPL